MARILTDTFTDTAGAALSTHTPEVGAPWTALVGGAAFTGENAIINNNGTGTTIYHNVLAGTAEVDATAEIVVKSALGRVGMIARMQSGTDFYHARLDADASQVQLYRFSGTLGNTTLGTAAWTPTLGTHTLYLYCRSSDNALFVYVNGVYLIGVFDSSYPNTGNVGIRMFNTATDTTGLHMTSMTADDASVAATPRHQAFIIGI